MSGTSAPMSKTDRSANCAVATSTYTGIAASPATAATPNATESGRSGVSGTRAATGRTIAILRMKRPIAVITVRKAAQRAISSEGVAEVSEVDGITNCGAGPGLGPTANVKAPRTGWPSTEIARQ